MLSKKLSLVLASLALVIGCSYFLTGKVIQKRYYETIAKLNEQPNLKVRLLNYKRGPFHSNAELEIEMAANEDTTTKLPAIQVIPLKQTITHGPVIAVTTPKGFRVKVLAAELKTTFGAAWQKSLEEYTKTQNPLTITTLVDFSNQANTWIRLSAIDQTTPTEFHVAWDTISGEIKHDLNFANYHGTITFPQLVMNRPDWKFKVSDMALNLDTSNQNDTYSSNHTVNTKTISFSKQDKELVKLSDTVASLTFTNKNNNLSLDLEATVANSQIVSQQFAQDKIKLQANNINRDTLKNFPNVGALSPKATIDLMQQLTLNSTELTLELPKHFTEALLSYVSFELYRASPLGQYDLRPEQTVLQDISGSINKLVQGAVKQRLFLDKGAYYALNFEREASTQG